MLNLTLLADADGNCIHKFTLSQISDPAVSLLQTRREDLIDAGLAPGVVTGKSYMLKEVLPAVANTYYSSGGSGRQHAGTVLSEPNFLHVNCLGCDRSRGVSGFLKEFLAVLKRSAAKQQLSAAASTPAPRGNSAVTAAGAIQDFMERLPRDRLNFLLIDEAQSFYLLERAMPGKKSPGKSPRRKVAVRGSTLDEDAHLQGTPAGQPPLGRLGRHGQFHGDAMGQRCSHPVLADMRMVLQVLGQPTSQVLLLRELVDTMAGVERAKLPLAFKALLANFTTEQNGRLYLDNPLFAQVLQAATTESGELLDSITAIPSLSSTMFRELVVLGERCKDKDFDSYEDLHSLLEAMASALALTPDGLLKADWFIQEYLHCIQHQESIVALLG
ncbi:hypothetical protein VOLCADRAFT_108564 [Volvox carteri f. nagariensis]|uniref:Uncharacterized protein n=1 Tax=Volvox carteri f. nagariensis TaxID=3068 RepID=D8UKZ2_VOLCA|nr:uncharacterized protein VOLCADRAFT_108564 [Volvox carteri f. nagariensis]EFJ39606.1 hypothetical protein VOLCADRAFT_108564 [Volvox carteri f. nagariensis]|eukprot:XP_002959327.1 hypothetical protein VOLCADRAFT_108564 [Volvox carteri f. nagariensis]